ncbi:glycosyltransferase [Pseudarthrobacter enclensis]|jgi:rhamnosyltransferase|uniref:glycosyltransferase n=1 Tax=Pseudarthrobacter enclensis TaxID=993070 RepID=UPI003EDF3719
MADQRSAVTVAVVSAFNPQRGILENCAALLEQCAAVVVVDDGSNSPDNEIFAALELAGCIVHRLDKNTGIAAALNRGVEIARSINMHPRYILTMDQDSIIGPSFVHSLEKGAEAARKANLGVGMVAPGQVSGLPSRIRKNTSGVLVGDEPVQSGLLIPVECFDAVGAFREDLFIDGVDSDFYLRAKEQRLQCVVVPAAALSHSLGSMTTAGLGLWRPRWAGQPLMIRTAAPWRYYFIVRNRLLLSRAYAVKEPYWTVRGLLMDLRHLLIVSALADGRSARLGFALRGFWDGLRNVSGPMPPR